MKLKIRLICACLGIALIYADWLTLTGRVGSPTLWFAQAVGFQVPPPSWDNPMTSILAAMFGLAGWSAVALVVGLAGETAMVRVSKC